MDGFDWLWYYAMQQMGDDESREQSEGMREKIMQREQASRTVALFIPSMHAQLLFNDIARSSLGNHMEFLDQTHEFHKKMRLYFYPKIFTNAAAEGESWAEFRPEYFSERTDVGWVAMVLPLLLIAAIMSIISAFNLRKLKAK